MFVTVLTAFGYTNFPVLFALDTGTYIPAVYKYIQIHIYTNTRGQGWHAQCKS